MQKMTYKRELDSYHTESKHILRKNAKGIFLCETEKKTMIATSEGRNLHKVFNKFFSITYYITSYFLFGGFDDNLPGSGVLENCDGECPKELDKVQDMAFLSGNICSPMFAFSRPEHCPLLLGTTFALKDEHHQPLERKFICDNNKTIDWKLVDDLFADCGPRAEDEPILVTQLVDNLSYKCKNSFQIPCRQGHTKCFNISSIYSYELDRYLHLIPCRTGEHIQSCKDFECHAKFKCKLSYCIPWAYVCDSKWDCPHGEDESSEQFCFQMGHCQNTFKCRNTKHMCMQLANVCDGQKRLPLRG